MKTDFLFSKVRSLKLCPLAILMSLEGNPFIVTHFKALISCQNFGGGQRCGSTLSLWNTNFKMTILLHNMASDHFHLLLTVYTYILRDYETTILHFSSTLFPDVLYCCPSDFLTQKWLLDASHVFMGATGVYLQWFENSYSKKRWKMENWKSEI